jgi:hypothetical protein
MTFRDRQFRPRILVNGFSLPTSGGDWYLGRGPRMFHVSGIAGSGKSVLAAMTVERGTKPGTVCLL